MTDGDPISGMLVAMDPAAGVVSMRNAGTSQTLPLSRLRRLTLTTPLKPVAAAPPRSTASGLSGIEDREYRLKSVALGKGPMVGRTYGFVHAREGMYLFPPDEHATGVLRVFVPRAAYSDYQFGPFAEDRPGAREIADPKELLQAIEQQQTMRVLPIGHSFIELGLLSPAELERALANQTPDVSLGEMLVRARTISRSDLDRALAHKLGYPRVDLEHFPIDPNAIRSLPLERAIAMKAVPLMLDGGRLIVAVYKLARANKLRVLPGSTKPRLVPVLAPRIRVLETLERLSLHQSWRGVPLALRFFESTT